MSIVSVVHGKLCTDCQTCMYVYYFVHVTHTYYPAVIVVTFALPLYPVVEGQMAEVQLNSTLPAETVYTIQVVQVDGRE